MQAEQLTGPVAYHGEGPVWSERWGGLRTFGGSDLDQLFITTSREGLGGGDDPLAGSVFRSAVGVASLPVREFAG